MKRLFKRAFFVCGWLGLLANLIAIPISVTREVMPLQTALELFWIGGTTFFGLGALVLDDDA